MQDIDSRGRVTSHSALPVTVAFAMAGEPSQGSANHEDITARNQQKTDVAVVKGSVENRLSDSSEPAAWISEVRITMPLFPT
ncbi:MAG: hypothetical protein HZA12_07495 [Nitrospirae bacterium]|nr:hypothetical protein [Nitrospirota bacterium]